jgi:hypothetical protein
VESMVICAVILFVDVRSTYSSSAISSCHLAPSADGTSILPGTRSSLRSSRTPRPMIAILDESNLGQDNGVDSGRKKEPRRPWETGKRGKTCLPKALTISIGNRATKGKNRVIVNFTLPRFTFQKCVSSQGYIEGVIVFRVSQGRRVEKPE